MSWLRAFRVTARSGLQVERKRLEPLIAVRAALGLAAIVGVSLELFGPAVAASSAFGAFQAAIATFQRSWRPRPVLALASGLSLGISTFLGYLAGPRPAIFLALLALWIFLAGLSWAVGPTVGILASSNVAIMLITITLPTSVLEAAGHAAMIVCGGLVQAGLILLFPVRRWGAQRDALADALAAEADYARRLRHDPVAPFDPAPLMTARDAAALTPRQARRRPADLRGSRGLAERIRPVLASLADPAVGVPEEGPDRARVRELLAAAGQVLDAAARAVRHGEPVRLPSPALAVLRTPDTEAVLTGPAYRAAVRLTALLGDVAEAAGAPPDPDRGPGSRWATLLPGLLLDDPYAPTSASESGATDSATTPRSRPEPARAPGAEPSETAPTGYDATASETRSTPIVGRPSPGADPDAASAPLDGSTAEPGPDPSTEAEPEPDEGTPEPPPAPLVRPSLLELIPLALRAMRDQVRRNSPIRRHAIRVTAVGVTGYLIGNALPLGHGYWAPLTSVMVMRPDFSQTYGRAVARFGGTLLGVGLATGVVQLVHPDAPLAGVLAIACAGLTYLLMRTGYAVSQVTISAYVVFLLGMGGEALSQTVPERVLLTLVGGLLAMLGYALYPAWETPRLRSRLADWLAADGRYAAAVVRHYAEPVDHPNSAVRDTLLEARTTRLAWQDAVERAQSEPVRHRGLSRSAADDAEHALARIARAAMLLEAHLPEDGTTPVPSAARLADAIEEGTKDAARAVRERQVPDWEPIRAALEAWTGEGVPDRVVRQGADLLMEAFEELSEAMGATDVPMSVQGTDNSARNKATSREETKPRDETGPRGEAKPRDADGSQQPRKNARNGTRPPDGTTPR